MTMPIVQLTFYQDAILCTRYEEQGQTTYPVSPQDVAEAVSDVHFSTGWLPPRTLLVERRNGVVTVAIHVPRGRHRVHVETPAGAFQWCVPMPDLVFVGRGTAYSVFATKSTPAPDVALYYAPCSNVFGNGVICSGNTPFPVAAPNTIESAFDLFMHQSIFNLHLSQERVVGRAHVNVLTLWQDLAAHPRAPFPRRALRPFHFTLAGVLR